MVLPYEIDEKGIKLSIFQQKFGVTEAYHEPWGNNNHKIWVYKWENEVIWGITSMLIKRVFRKTK